jgi:hypothetical protein
MVDDAAQANREASKGMPHYSQSFVQLGKLFHDKNYFKILKKMLEELLQNTNLNISFLLDVVVYCCMLHNLILNGINEDVESLMIELEIEN